MNWLSRFIGGDVGLTVEQTARLAKWQGLPAANLQQDYAHGRLVVVDVETSGLNPVNDRLIAIGAIAIDGGKIRMQDSFEVVMRQEEASDRENILVHGIGGTAQVEGLPPADALLSFLEFLGKSPLVAFHVAFDETVIGRALKSRIGLKFDHPWIDLAYIAPALYPSASTQRRTLDDWTSYFNIRNYSRHSALADALATAELFLALQPSMTKKGIQSYRQLIDLERAQRRMNQGV